MKFNSAICTTKVQSERLLALGLKKETADMVWLDYSLHPDVEDWRICADYEDWGTWQEGGIPAWSLHRLIEMIQEVCTQVILISHRVDIRSNVKRIAYSFDVCDNLYDNIIDCIEWLIKEGYFNKEYLVNQAEIDEHCKGVLEYLDYIKGEEE